MVTRMEMKYVPASPLHEKFHLRMVDLMKDFPELSSPDMLALVSHFVGQLVALQDQRKITPQMAMEIVARNIEHGNQQAIIQLADTVSTPN